MIYADVVDQARDSREDQKRDVEFVAEIERDDATVDDGHERREHHDEPVVHGAKRGDVLSEWVDTRNECEDDEQNRSHRREKCECRGLRHRAVGLSRRVPVGRHSRRQF
ncbi:hypothetical protein JCM17092_02430 [Haloplanus litoreus]